MTMTMTRGGSKILQTLKKMQKWGEEKDISSISVWNPLTMSMTMTMTRGGSKNVTNYEKGAKIVGKKGYILKFSMELIGYKHDHNHGG